MKFILIPDSFKGTLSSSQVYAVMDEKIKKHFPNNLTASIPVADRSEGSMDTFITAVGGVEEYVTVENPYFEDMRSYFGLIDAGQTAVIEVASCTGLPLVEDRKSPRLTITCGVGQLILAAARKGVKKIIVGLGGSSASDGSCGTTATISIRFYSRDGRRFIPTGGTTADTDRIDLSGRDSLLEQVEIVTMCDIDSPMHGPVGTSFIFGPRKGAGKVMVLQLDEGVRNLSKVIAQTTGTDISQVPGTGAAGAMDAGTIALFGSRLQMGIQTVLDTVRFNEIIGDADYTLTSEGKLDSQSLRDKVVVGIAEKAREQAKSVIVVVGGTDGDEIGRACDMGVTAVFPINRLPQDFSVSKHRSRENLAYTVDNIIRLIEAGQGEH